jgi:hypothetical protein
MKRKSARYLGMTGVQVGILAGLSLMALLSIGGVLWLVLAMLLSPDTVAAPAPVATQIPVTVSPAPVEQATVQLTDTPTALPVATVAPPGGWIEFKTQGAGFWLPNNFVGGDMLDERVETIQKVNKLGKYFRNVFAEMKDAQEETVLWMIDKNMDQSVIITSLRVQHFVSTEDKDKSIGQFLDDHLNNDASGTPVAMLITINETKKITLLGQEGRRLIYQTREGEVDAIGVAYFIKDGADFWSALYVLDPNEFIDMMPMVEQSIHTFNLMK